MVGDRTIDIPSYTVTVAEEDSVHFTPKSKIPEMLEKNKVKEPKVEESAEGEEVKVEATVEDKPSTD
jgi:small subunit ribosomal protein S4